MTKNFEIVEIESGWSARAITPAGDNMAEWMKKNGSDSLLYPTPSGAAEAAEQMDRAIHIRGGKPWAIYKEKSAVQQDDAQGND